MNVTPESSKITLERGFSLESLKLIGAIIICVLGQTFACQSIIAEQSLILNFCSVELWTALLKLLGAKEILLEQGHSVIDVPIFPCCLFPAGGMLLIILLAGFLQSRQLNETLETKGNFWQAVQASAVAILPWGMIPGIWFICMLGGLIANSMTVTKVMYAIPHYMLSLTLGGMLLVVCSKLFVWGQADVEVVQNKPKLMSVYLRLGMMIGAYTAIYTMLNWSLYFNLRMPHGDSAMYEEHLFNLLHGKGFRSYLDQGLFLGEHIQVIHVLLMPIYFWWQSVLTLEFLQSCCLALSAIPVYRMASRASGSHTAGLLMAGSVLVYYPLQFLDISIDLKTFRPTAFCIPALLCALDAMELKRYRLMSFWLLVTLSGQEDLTLVVGPIGLWLVTTRVWAILQEQQPNRWSKISRDAGVKYGLIWMIAAPVYLYLAMKGIHWFRGGVEIHYAGYFQKFGKSMSEVIQTMTLNPGLVMQELCVTSTLTYFIGLLLPLGFMSLRSPGRLLTGGILFITLCLNELNEGRARAPHYHFHAPIIPLIFWSAAMGLKPASQQFKLSLWRRFKELLSNVFLGTKGKSAIERMKLAACFSLCCGLGTGLFFTLSPLGVPFWDHGSEWYYGKLYVQSERAKQFDKLAEIPLTSRVASTDFVHPRFTHHARSYDYSNYKRKQSNYLEQVPDDTDYIVIDTAHPYSTIKRVEELREWKEERDLWELLEDQTSGYFIVLRRKGTK